MSFFGSDRRKYPRFHFQHSLFLNISFEYQDFQISGTFQNISLSGCAFTTKQIQLNQHHIILSTPSKPHQLQWENHNDTLISDIEVCWYNWMKATDLFYFGVQFINSSDQFKIQLQQLISTLKEVSPHHD